MANEIDPRLLPRFTVARATRRQFLGRSAAAAAVLAIGPSLVAACGSKPGPSAPVSNALRISNWPFYMADGFIADFQNKAGITVDYREDFNDNEEWFAKVNELLSRKQDIGCDLVVPTSFMVGRLHSLGWLNNFNAANIPNLKNMRPDLLNASVDPGRKFSAPYMSGLVGLAYNRAVTGRDIKTIEDLWDPAFKGKISMFADAQDGLGMIMLSQGNSPENPTTEIVRKAVDLVKEQKDKGQVRKFTGNDYINDLAAGNIIAGQAYSGDIVQLQADNPDLQFVVPVTGGTIFIDTMVIPYTTQHQDWAETWINYVYDRQNYARLIAHIKYVPVLSNMLDDLNKIDPKLAANPLINPPPSVLDNVKSWPALSDQQTQEFNKMYAAVTGG
ncbi:MAG: spermidine/putrescine transport system substrate-binding protein [Mycobacterium sp.]|jgi:spermidine/putrescine transport system substrate-binding protein|nr:spermidine/putrescine transport system substrate-binding protein [Mycobacterium sp.]